MYEMTFYESNKLLSQIYHYSTLAPPNVGYIHKVAIAATITQMPHQCRCTDKYNHFAVRQDRLKAMGWPV